MKVKELIVALSSLPPDANVTHLWDGEARTAINHVWLARNGEVVTADDNMVCYSEGSRPCTAPTQAQDRFWRTPNSE
jgi:hypothetical protein